MQFDFIHKETWLHKINPSFKLIVILVLFIMVLFIHNINIMMNYMVVILFMFLLFSGQPAKRVILILIPVLFMFITTAIPMIFFGKGDTTWFGWGLIHITEESFFRGIHVGLRALIFTGLGIIFALTTRPVFLFYSLMQQLKIPSKYAYSFLAGLRLIPIMIEEFQTIRYAMKVRGVQHKRGMKGFYEVLRKYSIPMLSQSIRRAHRVAVAMEAKRFSQVKNRTYYYKITFSWNDIMFVLYFLILLSAAYFISVQYPYFAITDVRYK
ncbi:energy-coupling factor transporter transmembrane component T family protein [Chengkuizengella axinellae]|uniref:Energy-coupling factor transporter transmembrane component T n=1 Tax=Chengkuizengella axinellae TaxID=3064388 RepID=A0ABT9J074_9BACL|nr:energy-coupling factor transporter transmembrane component T [Chengkuizengella sp. 2205SS18-9]MDP5274983.1 energy-coupling factor transporter transmembrane component T [Chengkuizengella sp. 2205SS18-9]